MISPLNRRLRRSRQACAAARRAALLSANRPYDYQGEPPPNPIRDIQTWILAALALGLLAALN